MRTAHGRLGGGSPADTELGDVLPEMRPPEMADVAVMSVVTMVSIVTSGNHSFSSVLLQAVAVVAASSRQNIWNIVLIRKLSDKVCM